MEPGEPELKWTSVFWGEDGELKVDKRIVGYDFIRSFAILTVFIGHILTNQPTNEGALLAICTLTPGLTMSLLGFISAALLSAREYDSGSFLVKRFTRIYVPLLLCLTVVLSLHAFLGKKVLSQHTLLHAMGLSAFFEMFLVQNKATIGGGLWFITVISLMYLVLPLLQKLFRHPRGLMHLILLVIFCTGLNVVTYGMQSTWNVVISFAVGVFCVVNGHIKGLIGVGSNRVFAALGSTGLLIVAALSTAHVLPDWIRGLLFAFYPLAFVPFLFAVSEKLPAVIVSASSFFGGVSYEFYILHFYFINAGFKELLPGVISLYSQIGIAFVVTFILATVISTIAFRLKKVIDNYLLTSSGGV